MVDALPLPRSSLFSVLRCSPVMRARSGFDKDRAAFAILNCWGVTGLQPLIMSSGEAGMQKALIGVRR